MIGRVPRAQIALVSRSVRRLPRAERPQAHRREQFAAHRPQHRLPLRAVEDRIGQRDGEELVWPQRSIVGVDHVEQMFPSGGDEAGIERFAKASRSERDASIPRRPAVEQP
jgi:hypothetical protein